VALGRPASLLPYQAKVAGVRFSEVAVDYGINGLYVTRLLDQAAKFRGYPAAVRIDTVSYEELHAPCARWLCLPSLRVQGARPRGKKRPTPWSRSFIGELMGQ